jgi:BirA family transcriptional regulator, biotin operon repressor / biotin---[acetyl-CoA-carboxylase] ligase
MRVSYFSLLRILADGSFHSGERLGQLLGVSRARVWNLVRRIEALGLRVFKVRGRGYRLAESLDLFDRGAIAGQLARRAPELRIEFLDECPSTNTVLAERAAHGAPSGAVLACERQIEGRGRRGNRWVSVLGGSLAFSILWRFPGGGSLAGLSLAVAVGVARALEQLGIEGIRVKWPNDLLCEGRKMGGILVEVSGEARGPSTAVIGVGINVRLDKVAMERIGQSATDLTQCSGLVPPRSTLLLALLEEFGRSLARFSRGGFAPFREEWLRRHAWQGRQVTLSRAGRRVAEGRAVDIAEDGALVLESPLGLERFHSGELSLRQR